MATVPTVRGPVDTAALGPTLMHEHVFVLTVDVQNNYPDEWDEQRQLADAIRQLGELKAAGIDTIVDPTVVGLGRHIPRMQRVCAEVELNMVVATGIYTYDQVPFFFFFFFHRGPALDPLLPEPMVEMFVRDLTEGIAGTGVRAGMLKCAIDEPGLTPGVERVLRAVAAAHRQTGAPVTVHTHPGSRSGLVVARVLAEEGVDPGRVVLGHSGDTTDVEHLGELAEAGFLLGMDRFGLDTVLPTDARVAVVAELVRRGYADRMVLSHDSSCYLDWLPPATRAAALPRWHYLHISNDVLPALRAAGVSDGQLRQLLVDNPRRLFTPPEHR